MRVRDLDSERPSCAQHSNIHVFPTGRNEFDAVAGDDFSDSRSDDGLDGRLRHDGAIAQHKWRLADISAELEIASVQIQPLHLHLSLRNSSPLGASSAKRSAPYGRGPCARHSQNGRHRDHREIKPRRCSDRKTRRVRSLFLDSRDAQRHDAETIRESRRGIDKSTRGAAHSKWTG